MGLLDLKARKRSAPPAPLRPPSWREEVAALPPEERQRWQERAGAIEQDEGLSRGEAKRRALAERSNLPAPPPAEPPQQEALARAAAPAPRLVRTGKTLAETRWHEDTRGYFVLPRGTPLRLAAVADEEERAAQEALQELLKREKKLGGRPVLVLVEGWVRCLDRSLFELDVPRGQA